MRTYSKLQNGSDIRGVAVAGYNDEAVTLDTKATYRLAAAFTQWLANYHGQSCDTLTIAVGHDSRISSPELKQSILQGITESGANGLDCGLTSTPSMFMSTQFDQIHSHGAIMITASHLPYNKNGMKFFTPDGGLGHDDIHSILSLVDMNQDYHPNTSATYSKAPLLDTYCQHLVDIIRKEVNSPNHDTPLEGMHIIVDAGNGAGGFFAHKVLEPLGAKTHGSQFLEPDGTFPNHIPNPENKEAMASAKEATLASGADLGIIFDTDVDRAAVIDHEGHSINRNRLIALMSAITLEKHPHSTIVTDSVTSAGLTPYIESLGGHHHRFMRGYRNVIDESIRLNKEGTTSHLAIETSGHGAFKENYFLDDGAYIVTRVLIKLAQLKKEGKTLNSLIDHLEEPADAMEIRLPILHEDFKTYGNQVLEDFKNYVISESSYSLVEPNYEGIRANYEIEGATGWLLIRLSLHDPVIPINIESVNPNGCTPAKRDILNFLSTYSGLKIVE